jgi:hypothetical protein
MKDRRLSKSYGIAIPWAIGVGSRLLGAAVIILMLPGQEANQTRFCHPLR